MRFLKLLPVATALTGLCAGQLQCPIQTCPERWPGGQKTFCSSQSGGGELKIDGKRTGICSKKLCAESASESLYGSSSRDELIGSAAARIINAEQLVVVVMTGIHSCTMKRIILC